MRHYQKLTTMIFRIIGVLAMFIGVVSWIVISITMFLITSNNVTNNVVLVTFVAPTLYLVGGIIMFSLSRILAIWICLDFDEPSKR
ncbi:MAG: hypothetical protein ACR2N3_04555 [Pyrinomonadaceae bacterium]